MRLCKIYVSSFGKLVDFTYEFNNGLNSIKEDNGWGKTTLATFVKSMFYGLTDGKRSVAENERIKYKPWNSTGKFGGYVVFLWKDKKYKIERFFGNKASEDTVKLFDATTNKEFSDTNELGKRIFGIDEEGFLSTTYLSQKDFEAKSNPSLTAKFNEVCEEQNTDAYDRATAKLEEKLKKYRMRGEKGLIPDTKTLLNKIDSEIAEANLAAETAETAAKSAKTLEEELEELKNKMSNFQSQIEQAGREEVVLMKKNEYNEAIKARSIDEEEKNKAEKTLNGEPVDEERLKKLKQCIEDYSANKSRLQDRSDDVEKLTASLSVTPKKNGKIIIPCFAIALVFIVLAFVFLNSIVLATVFFAVAAIGIVIGAFLVLTRRTSKTSPDIIDLLSEKRKELDGYKKIDADYEKNLGEFFSAFNIPYDESFQGKFELIKNASESFARADNNLSKQNKIIEELSEDKAIFSESAINYDLNKLKNDFKTTSDCFRVKSELLAKKRAEEAFYREQSEKLSELLCKRQELTGQLEEYRKKADIIEATLQYLKLADENLKIKYRLPLQESLNKYLSLLGVNAEAEIDVDLNVSVIEKSGGKCVDYYSKGYRNIFEICKRFALTDVLFTKEKPFMVLDDPFYNLDDEKLSFSLELLKKLKDEYQLIYLVCHQSRVAKN